MGIAAPENDEERKIAAIVSDSYDAGWRDAIDLVVDFLNREVGSREEIEARVRAIRNLDK